MIDFACRVCRTPLQVEDMLAGEKLESEHGLVIPRETLRQWLLAEGLWSGRRKRERHRRRRERRACFGELVQADASEHEWLEGRGPRLTLVGMIDDATSRVVLRFHCLETGNGRRTADHDRHSERSEESRLRPPRFARGDLNA